MSKNYSLSTKLSDLEFVEELSNLELDAVTGGGIVTRIDDEFGGLFSGLRAETERILRERVPGLPEEIFGR